MEFHLFISDISDSFTESDKFWNVQKIFPQIFVLFVDIAHIYLYI